jgi:hypothetical protein
MSPPISPLWRGVHLAVLWAFALVQPLLDLLGDNAEFFVARGNGAADVIVLGLALTLLPPLVLLGAELLVGRFSPRAAWLLHLGLVGLLAATFVLLALDGALDGGGAVLLVLALALGAGAAAAYARSDGIRSLLSYLAPAPVVFLVMFLFLSDASDVVFPADEAEALAAGSANRPVVVVLFDEFPTASLMDGKGGIEERRFPNFAALAREATWYRGATTVADHTDDAIPAILTGLRPDPALDPLIGDYPDNLFTLLAGSLRLNVHERTARLCPESFCQTESGSFGDRMSSLVSDLSVVSAHLVLPDSMTGGLPPVNEGFSDFETPEKDDEARPHVGVDQEAISSLLRGIERTPKALHFIHLLLPHVPWRYLPDGRDYVHGEVWREFDEQGERWADDAEWVTQQALRAHMFQSGYADALLGRVMQSVREAGIWDDAVVVVAADHGSGFTAGAPRRLVDDENLGEIAPMPLFIKAPGQDAGRVDDRPMRTIDVVPTIADLLGIEIPYEVDGEPASEVARGDSETLTILPGEGTEPLTFAREDALTGLDRAAARIRQLFGAGWEGVWEMGPNSELIGQDVDALDEVRTSVEASAALIRDDELSEVDPEATFVPSLVVAKLDGVSSDAPLAVAVNGRIAAVTRAYESVDGGVRTTALVPPESFEAGANDVQIYAVVARGDRLALEPLGGT